MSQSTAVVRFVGGPLDGALLEFREVDHTGPTEMNVRWTDGGYHRYDLTWSNPALVPDKPNRVVLEGYFRHQSLRGKRIDPQ